MSPELVAEAVRLGVIEQADADRYLRGPKPTRPMHIVPKVPPPPERLRLVQRPDGRLRRARAGLTKALLAAGIIDRTAIRDRPAEVEPVKETA